MHRPSISGSSKWAQAQHAGIWAGLPPGPAALDHPVVQTTGELVANGQVYLLDGIQGFPAQFYTLQLKNYIVAHGDRLICQLHQSTDAYVCLLPNGADIAAVALSSGLARVSNDASPQYRADQAKAVADKRGIWADPLNGSGISQAPLVAAVPNCCEQAEPIVPTEYGYAEGLPFAIIDAEPVFFGL